MQKIHVRTCLSLLLGVSLAGCSFPGMRFDIDAPVEAGYASVSMVKLDVITALEKPEEVAPKALWQELLPESVVEAAEGGVASEEGKPRLGAYAEYVVGPGDQLEILLWGEESLTSAAGSLQPYLQQLWDVREDGKIFYPYAGLQDVGGLTAREIRLKLTEALTRYIKEPQLEVRVVEYQSQPIVVGGEVGTAGLQYLTSRPMRVIEAIELAGGLNDKANKQVVYLTRGDKTYKLPLAEMLMATGQAHGILLKAEDQIYVPDNSTSKVFMLGELPQKSIPIDYNGMSLADAVAAAGGINLTFAKASEVYVIRKKKGVAEPVDGALTSDEIEVFWLDARSPDAFLLADSFVLAPRDIVYVSTFGFTRFNRVFSQIFPSLQSVYQVDTILNRN